MVEKICFLSFIGLLVIFLDVCLAESPQNELHSIEGRIRADRILTDGHEHWLRKAHVFVDGGEYITIPDREGNFKLTGLLAGSYVVEISHPTFVFPPYRVDISSKSGKLRARKLNHVQPNTVETVEYPLIFKANGKAPYFQKREEWRITDVLKNPMVLMMVLPMILIFIMPKMMNAADDETKKEMENSMSMLRPNQQMPDVSQMMTNLFGAGGNSAPKSKKKK